MAARDQERAGGPLAGLGGLRRVGLGIPPAATRLGGLTFLAGLVAVALPWANFVVHYASTPSLPDPLPGPGAATLLTIASGMPDLEGSAAPVSALLVWGVIVLALAGAIAMAYHPSGAFLSLAALALYGVAVQGQLTAAGGDLRSPVVFGMGAGFWLMALVAATRLTPAALAAIRRRRQSAAPAGPATILEKARPSALAGGSIPRDLLIVNGLTVRFFTYDGVIKALDGVSFTVREREILGIVGETGCGKSVTAKAILRLIPDPPGRITGGEVVFEGLNLLDGIEQEARIKVNAKGRAKIKRNRRIAKRMEAVLRTVRGNEISMIFQEPSAALNPVMRVGDHIGEAFITHQLGEICKQVEATRELSGMQRRFFARLKATEAARSKLGETFRALTGHRAIFKAAQAAGDAAVSTAERAQVERLEQEVFRATLKLGVSERRTALWRRLPIIGRDHLMAPINAEVKRRVVEMLKQVNIPDPESKADAYPFELSGGMQQRIMIATALACRPQLLIADEPTTALDVTIQAQILSLLRGLRDEFGSSVILITHDLGVVAETCERVGVMYAGVMAEIGQVADIFARAKHPYTVGLLRSIPETYTRTGKLSIIPGTVPSLLTPPGGCRFHPRCPFAAAACATEVPAFTQVAPGHFVACHLYDRPELFPPEKVAQRDEGLGSGWLEAMPV